MAKKVLIITYYWPPCGGAGVQRWLKFAKYLPEFGWEPIVLTVDPAYAEYPAIDESLIDEIPSSIRVYKTKARNYFRLLHGKKSPGNVSAGFATGSKKGLTDKIARFIRGNFFIPDPRRGWNSFAIKKASQLIKDENINHLITSSPPHSTQLTGIRLKKKFPAINWIADFRDPWTGIYYYNKFYPCLTAKLLDKSYETRVLKNCDKISSAWPSLGKQFSQIANIPATKTEFFPNGYDESDFCDLKKVDPDIFTISYVGSLSDQYPIKGLINSLLDIIKNNKMSFKLRFIGIICETQMKILNDNLGDYIEFVRYSDHNKAIQYMLNSNLLLLIVPDHSDRKSILSGKLFEYLRSGVPILCIGPPDGDAAKIINNNNAGKTFFYTNNKEISSFILRIYENKLTYDRPINYSRQIITRGISEYLEG